MRRMLSGICPTHVVVQLYQAIVEPLDGTQVEELVPVTPRDQRNAVPDEHGHDADDELVDRLRVEKRRNELAAMWTMTFRRFVMVTVSASRPAYAPTA